MFFKGLAEFVRRSRPFVRLLPGSALSRTFLVQLPLASNLQQLIRCTAKLSWPKSAKTVLVWTGHAVCGTRTSVLPFCLFMVDV